MPDGNGAHPKIGLYETVASVAGREEMNEEQFIDAVSRNLERGRFLLLVNSDLCIGLPNSAAATSFSRAFSLRICGGPSVMTRSATAPSVAVAPASVTIGSMRSFSTESRSSRG